MKILLAPSKTKTLQGSGENKYFAPEVTGEIVADVQKLGAAELGAAMKLNEEKGAQWLDFYKHFPKQPKGMAIASYNGLVFKRLDYKNLNPAAQSFCKEHFLILSALYGVVWPEQNIVDYRLDLVDKIYAEKGKNLTKKWQPLVIDYLSKEDWLLNLSSKEYAKLIAHPRVMTVEFLDLVKGKYRQSSTRSKEMRGLLARYICEEQITNYQDLPKNIGDYSLKEDISEFTSTLSYFRE